MTTEHQPQDSPENQRLCRLLARDFLFSILTERLSGVVASIDSQLGFESSFCPLSTLGLGASYLTHLGLSFLSHRKNTCKDMDDLVPVA